MTDLKNTAKRVYQTKTATRKTLRPIKKAEPPVINYKLIGRRIKNARLNTGITQEYLSELVEVTPAFIGHIERGERSVSLQTLLKICMVLNVSTDYLFSMEETTDDIEIVNEIVQMIRHRPLETKQAVLDIISTTLKYME